MGLTSVECGGSVVIVTTTQQRERVGAMRKKIVGVCDYCENFTTIRRDIDPGSGEEGEWYCDSCLTPDSGSDMVGEIVNALKVWEIRG